MLDFSLKQQLRGQFALLRQLQGCALRSIDVYFLRTRLLCFVIGNDSLHVRQTVIAEQDILFVNYLMKLVAR